MQHQQSAAGVLLMRPGPWFLLMKHPKRWDLPKGRADAGETVEETALREMEEETGISRHLVQLDDRFRFIIRYQHSHPKRPEELVNKTVTYFLGYLTEEPTLILTEHNGYQWFAYAPPHAIQAATIDPLLSQLEQHFAAYPERLAALRL